MKTSENRVFSNPNYHLYYIAESNVLIVEGYGNIKLETTQEAWLKVLDIALEHKTTKWVHDQSKVELQHHQASNWWEKEWFPLAGQRLRYPGKRLTATILPSRFYAEMSSKQTISKTLQFDAVVGEQNKYLEHLYFKTFEEAYNWLVEHPETVNS